MQNQVNLLAWLWIGLSSFGVIFALFIFSLLTGVALIAGEPQAATILTFVASAVALLLIVLSIPGIVGGIGLLRRQGWARILILVLAAISLFNFPVGTALGIYSLWVLLQRETQELFGSSN